mmetsp:Transcript_42303/g.85610  ORF Transcript_42303/g.85610 Transcript_42303/m.85610 type:complete len:253 (+) Transcript_42303:181-939(+)
MSPAAEATDSSSAHFSAAASAVAASSAGGASVAATVGAAATAGATVGAAATVGGGAFTSANVVDNALTFATASAPTASCATAAAANRMALTSTKDPRLSSCTAAVLVKGLGGTTRGSFSLPPQPPSPPPLLPTGSVVADSTLTSSSTKRAAGSFLGTNLVRRLWCEQPELSTCSTSSSCPKESASLSAGSRHSPFTFISPISAAVKRRGLSSKEAFSSCPASTAAASCPALSFLACSNADTEVLVRRCTRPK